IDSNGDPRNQQHLVAPMENGAVPETTGHWAETTLSPPPPVLHRRAGGSARRGSSGKSRGCEMRRRPANKSSRLTGQRLRAAITAISDAGRLRPVANARVMWVKGVSNT